MYVTPNTRNHCEFRKENLAAIKESIENQIKDLKRISPYIIIDKLPLKVHKKGNCKTIEYGFITRYNSKENLIYSYSKINEKGGVHFHYNCKNLKTGIDKIKQQISFINENFEEF